MNHLPVPILITLCLLATACASDSSSGSTSASTTGESLVPAVDTSFERSTSSTAPAPSTSATPSPTSTTTSAPATTTALAGATPVEQQLAWLVEKFSADDAPPVDEIEAHFASVFLAQVPPQVFIDTTAQLLDGAEAPFTLVGIDEQSADGLQANAVFESANAVRFDITISVEAAEPHLINGLQATPRLDLLTDITIEELDDELAALAAESSLGVYEVTDGACDAVHEIRADRAMPLGSTFKLWVLAELAHQIEEGSASWDELLPIVDEHRSSPDGEVFPRDDGAEMTLRELAGLMISISDNTATDHLMARLGRENIEAALGRIGVTTVDPNVPMLSTGAFFQIKFIADAPNAADYRALDAAGRAQLLDELEAGVLPWVTDPNTTADANADGVPLSDPRDLDVEWFATPEDLCRTHVHLAELATRPGLGPVAEILEINPGIPFDAERWPTIRFKGGSEPGVLAGAWWLERNDGRRFVIAGGLSDPETSFSESTAVLAVASAIDLIS